MYRLLQRCDHRDVSPDASPAGSYLTDGARLFRVVGWCSVGRGDVLVALENCVTFTVTACTYGELDLLELRPVKRAQLAGAALADQLSSGGDSGERSSKHAAVGDR